MKNKILAFSAAILLASGIAFGFTQYANSGQCCDPQANTCNGLPCPAGECPPHCCPSGGGSSTAK
ncbi:MAG: hypothetical protein ABIQ93_12565 [Saprospiraceae bacterium]